jgi:Tfp pilus assembly protein PilP
MASIQVLLELIQNIIPEAYSTSMRDIVHLNRGKMSQIEEELMIDTAVFTPDHMRDYFSDEENLQTTKAENKNKIDKVLRATLQFRKKEHIEMLNFDTFRKIISIQNLKAIVNVNHFVNFTIQETGQNPLLNTKGYFLKSFLYFHLKKDMRFRRTLTVWQ